MARFGSSTRTAELFVGSVHRLRGPTRNFRTGSASLVSPRAERMPLRTPHDGIGFDMLQGCHFAEPLSEEALLDFVRESDQVDTEPRVTTNAAVGGQPGTIRSTPPGAR